MSSPYVGAGEMDWYLKGGVGVLTAIPLLVYRSPS